jgi:hypothetical protein
MPYRDFTFPYPPLAISVLGLLLHYGGPSFRIAQIAYDAVSLGCVFAVWVLARRFARPVPAFFVTLALAIAGANTSSFALFSPSILAALRASNVRVLDRAKTPVSPYKPTLGANTGVALLAGLFLGVIVAVARKRPDRSFRGPGQTTLWLNVPDSA